MIVVCSGTPMELTRSRPPPAVLLRCERREYSSVYARGNPHVVGQLLVVARADAHNTCDFSFSCCIMPAVFGNRWSFKRHD